MKKNTKPNRRKVQVSASRTINTFSYLSSVSSDCLERAEIDENGRNLMLAASMVFSAFRLEAFLNHIGSMKIPFWTTIERKLTPIDKLEVISAYLTVKINFGKTPFQTTKRMFRFRDALAHGKTQELNEETIQYLEDDEKPSIPFTDWEKEISIDTAKTFKKDVKDIIELLCKNAKIDLSEIVIRSHHSYRATQIGV